MDLDQSTTEVTDPRIISEISDYVFPPTRQASLVSPELAFDGEGFEEFRLEGGEDKFYSEFAPEYVI